MQQTFLPALSYSYKHNSVAFVMLIQITQYLYELLKFKV